LKEFIWDVFFLRSKIRYHFYRKPSGIQPGANFHPGRVKKAWLMQLLIDIIYLLIYKYGKSLYVLEWD